MTNRPLRILYCIDNLATGGTELQLLGLIERLDRARFAPHLFTMRQYDVAEFPPDCPHLIMDIPQIFSFGGGAAVMRLARWIKRHRIDVVQTYFPDATVVGGVAAILAGVSQRYACFRDMGFWRTRKHEGLLKGAYGLMTGYIANSEVVRDYFIAEFGLSPGKFRVIYNGVDVETLPWVDHTGGVRNVGVVGNLNRRVKRTDVFIRAAALLAPDFPEIRWHIIGAGEFRLEYEALAAELGLGERAVFAGIVEDVPRYLAETQIGVVASDSEGLSNALLEYQFKGSAIVATDVGGNPEIVRNRETGLLVPPDDPQQMADALRELIENNELRRTLARNARAFAEANFSWQKCLAAHDDLYGH